MTTKLTPRQKNLIAEERAKNPFKSSCAPSSDTLLEVTVDNETYESARLIKSDYEVYRGKEISWDCVFCAGIRALEGKIAENRLKGNRDYSI